MLGPGALERLLLHVLNVVIEIDLGHRILYFKTYSARRSFPSTGLLEQG
jgi:hypothetical protein